MRNNLYYKSGKKVGLYVLGCPKNLVDAEKIGFFLSKYGFDVKYFPEKCDWAIVFTCVFIDSAKEESISAILELENLFNKSEIKGYIIAGCGVDRYRNILIHNFPQASGFINSDKPEQILDFINKFDPDLNVLKNSAEKEYSLKRVPLELNHIRYLKISDGCNRNCSFCSIPYFKGRLHSIPIEKLLIEVENLKSQGMKELVIISQDTVSYGLDIYNKSMIFELLVELAKLMENGWVRIHYLYPSKEIEYIISSIKKFPNILPYFDLPIQHSSPEILEKMKRPDISYTISIIDSIRKEIPDSVIRSAFIVGFPGETEDDFLNLLNFIEKYRFERFGIFEYSDEDNTEAYSLKNKIRKK